MALNLVCLICVELYIGDGIADRDQELNRSLAYTNDLIDNRHSNDANCADEVLGLVRVTTSKKLLLDVSDSLLPERPGPTEDFANRWLAKDVDEWLSLVHEIGCDRLTILKLLFVELLAWRVGSRLVLASIRL